MPVLRKHPGLRVYIENVRTRTCDGADGPYLEIRGQFSGTIVSSDPRRQSTQP